MLWPAVTRLANGQQRDTNEKCPVRGEGVGLAEPQTERSAGHRLQRLWCFRKRDTPVAGFESEVDVDQFAQVL